MFITGIIITIIQNKKPKLFNFLCASKEDNKFNKEESISFMVLVTIFRYALYGIILLIISKIFL